MALTTRLKTGVNAALRKMNIQLDSLTAETSELKRLRRLEETGYFDAAVFPLPESFSSIKDDPIRGAIEAYSGRFADFEDASRNSVGYCFNNGFFGSPDAEVLYSVVRAFRPATILEVGSGHSTKLSRQAIRDGQLDTRLICIDPCPRTEVLSLADQAFACPVETLIGHAVFRSLQAGDVLFIDSSHALSPGNDGVALYLRILPELPSGVLIHVHDVFLPYDYPKTWVVDKRLEWNEQYLVQAMLMFGDAFEVLWAGHYLQRTDPRFSSVLPRAAATPATSLWLRKR